MSENCEILKSEAMPEYPDKYDEILSSYKRKEYKECLDHISSSSAGAQDVTEYKILKSVCLLQLGKNTEECHQVLNLVLKKYPDNAFAIHAKGLVLFKDGKIWQSLECFKKALELDPSSVMRRAEIMKEKAEKILADNERNRSSLLRARNRVTRFQCEVCEKFFAKKFNVDRHMINIHNLKPKSTFGRSVKHREGSSLSSHEDEDTSVDDESSDSEDNSQRTPFGCHLCGKSYTKPFSLNRHMMVHTDKRPHNCGICGMGFRQRSDMMRHEEIHCEELNYVCDHCGKRFKTRHYVSCHIHKHHVS